MIPEGKQPSIEHFFKKFLAIFEMLRTHKPRDEQRLSFGDINQKLLSIVAQKGPQFRALLSRDTSSKYIMPTSHYIGGNYWILKTTYQNRGIGIHVFKTLNELNTIIQTYILNAKDDITGTSSGGQSPRNRKVAGPGSYGYQATSYGMSCTPTLIPKNMSFIIQKYIEKPLLINKRKFDIRVWVLINQDMEVYFFKEGYLRTSAFEYKLSDNCKDQFVHLTNNAVQKNAKEYGKFEEGNMLSF